MGNEQQNHLLKSKGMNRITVTFILAIGLLFSCSRKEKAMFYQAHIPFTTIEYINLFIFKDRFIIKQDGHIVQTGHIVSIKGEKCLKDDISGEVYFFEKSDETLIFISGRFKDLIFINTNILFNGPVDFEFIDSDFKDAKEIIEMQIKLINEQSNLTEFSIDPKIENIFVNQDSTLKIYMQPNSSYRFYKESYLIDMGEYSIDGNIISFHSEPIMTFMIPYDEWKPYYEVITTTYKAYVVSNNSMMMGTLPYSLYGETLNLVDSWQ